VVYLRTLGESVIEVGEVRIGPSAPHVFAALLYLALECGRRVPRGRLRELLFPTTDERSGSHSLRQLLYRMRRMGVGLRADATGVLLPVDAVRADFQQFLVPADGARADLARISGGFLPGFAPVFSRPFAEWLEERRAELLLRICRTLARELGEHRRAARWRLAEETARAVLSLDPFNEGATLALAEALALTGSKLEAVRLLDSYLEEVGPRDRAFRLPATALRRRVADRLAETQYPASSRMVGREGMLVQLRGALERAEAGESLACHVWGEAGIGKTRLLTEFSRAATLGGARVEQVNAQPHDVRRPMGAFSDLVPALLKLPGALGCSPEAIGLLTRLFKYGGGPASSLSPDIRDAEFLSANITRAISELLDALTAESTIIVTFEDAQWFDAISLRVFSDLIAERKHRRLLVILTSRESVIGVNSADVHRLMTVRLQPLEPDDSRSLLADLFVAAKTQPNDELIDWCLAAAGGNPFFLQSLAARYIATGDLQTIPEPLAALLDHRLSLLDRRARRVFEACSVLGRHSTLDRLEAVLGAYTFEFLDGLQTLEEQGFVKSNGRRVSSTHILLSDIALGRTPPGVRTLLHRNTARVLQDEPLDQSSATLLWDCAEHWLQAGDRAKALNALRACARHALEIGHPGDACDVLVRASELTEAVSDRMDTAEALMVAGEIAERWELVTDAVRAYIQLAAQQGRPVGDYHEYRILELESLLYSGADPASLLPAFRRYAHDTAAPASIRVRAATGLVFLAEEIISTGLATEGFEAANAATTGAIELAPDRFKLDLVYYVVSGRFEEAVALARAGAKSRDGSVTQVCQRIWLAGFALLRAGLIEEGCASIESCFKMAMDAHLHSTAAWAAVGLACVLRDAGRTSEARSWHARAAGLLNRDVAIRRLLNHLSNCVLFALDEGDFEAARRALQRAAEIPASRAGVSRLVLLALEVRVKQLADLDDCSDAELKELLDGYFLGRGVGHHDEVIVTIWNALVRRRRVEYADALVRDYLNRHRRIRWPLSPELKEIAWRLAADQSGSEQPIQPGAGANHAVAGSAQGGQSTTAQPPINCV
jgi:DNA-binding SARP family transcriptional activator/tetratricopeptide (TPR) repeat protein